VDLSKAKSDAQWSLARPDWESIQGNRRSRFESETLLCSEQPGAELNLSFKGTAIGLYVLAGPDAGTIEYSIDGAPMRQLDLFHRFSKGLHYPRTVLLEGDLDSGAHVLTLRVADQRHSNSTGNAVRILNFVVN
ncbi:MAG: SGNH/GDSL hydrolase family protein, partial [Rubripirellula sp.]